jgi:hypothetical protein
MKQPLAVFGVALGAALGWGFLTILITHVLRMLMPEVTVSSFYTTSIATSLFAPVSYVLSFICFYQLGKKAKIFAKKTTILALLVGLMIGTTITTTFTTTSNLSLAITASLIISYSFAGVFHYLFPALAGLLFAEIKEKRHSQNLKVESEKQNLLISP